jgi:hypothetical protein
MGRCFYQFNLGCSVSNLVYESVLFIIILLGFSNISTLAYGLTMKSSQPHFYINKFSRVANQHKDTLVGVLLERELC